MDREQAKQEEGRMRLSWISLTGAEDSVDPKALADMSREHRRVEWALLAMDEAEGIGRNPSKQWRSKFFDEIQNVPSARSAIHLCGESVFRRILSEGPWEELSRCSRVQANLNARGPVFEKREAMKIWEALALRSSGLVIQWHEGVAGWAKEFMEAMGPDARVEILFDESKGRGALPSSWKEGLDGVRCGWAGGLGPETLARALPKIAAASSSSSPGSWVDMESALRTDGLFDLDKCRQALAMAEPWLGGPCQGKVLRLG